MIKSDAQVPSHVPAVKRTTWRAAWNGAYQKALIGGLTAEQSEAQALKDADASLHHYEKRFRIAKIDSDKREAWGIFTNEAEDKSGEICDYEAAKAAFKSWSKEAKDATSRSGQSVSLGNVRFQHSMTPVGKVISIEYRDDAKEVYGGTYISDDQAWQMVKDGVLTGFSQGGSYDWRKCNVCGTNIEYGCDCPQCEKPVVIRFGPEVAEMSVVDNPCVADAHFDAVKAAGENEMAKEITVPPTPKPKPEAVKAKVGEIAKELGALAAKDVPTAEDIKKGMYQIGQLAELLASAAYLRNSSIAEAAYENDPTDLEIADDLDEFIASGAEILKQLVEHETAELTARKAQGEQKTMIKDVAGNDLEKSSATLPGHLKECAKLHKAVGEAHSDVAKAHAAASENEDVCDADKKCHKAAAKSEDKIAKAHGAFAEKCDKCAKDMEEADKAAKTAKAANSGDVSGEVTGTMQDLVKKAVADMRENPELQAEIKKAVAVQMQKALESTLVAPLPQPKPEAAAGTEPVAELNKGAKDTTPVPRFGEGVVKESLIKLSPNDTGL
jgi:hypothetical protein